MITKLVECFLKNGKNPWLTSFQIEGVTKNRYVYKHIELLLSKVNTVINTDDEVEDYVLRKHKHWLTADFSSGGGKIYALQFQF